MADSPTSPRASIILERTYSRRAESTTPQPTRIVDRRNAFGPRFSEVRWNRPSSPSTEHNVEWDEEARIFHLQSLGEPHDDSELPDPLHCNLGGNAHNLIAEEQTPQIPLPRTPPTPYLEMARVASCSTLPSADREGPGPWSCAHDDQRPGDKPIHDEANADAGGTQPMGSKSGSTISSIVTSLNDSIHILSKQLGHLQDHVEAVMMNFESRLHAIERSSTQNQISSLHNQVSLALSKTNGRILKLEERADELRIDLEKLDGIVDDVGLHFIDADKKWTYGLGQLTLEVHRLTGHEHLKESMIEILDGTLSRSQSLRPPHAGSTNTKYSYNTGTRSNCALKDQTAKTPRGGNEITEKTTPVMSRQPKSDIQKTLIFPTAVVSPTATISPTGVWIYPQATVDGHAIIRKHTIIRGNAHVFAHATVNEYVTVCRGATIGKRAVIGANVIVGEDAIVGDRAKIFPDARVSSRVTIYPNATVGPNATIKRGAIIQGGAVIGKGVVVEREARIDMMAVVGDGAVVKSGSLVENGKTVKSDVVYVSDEGGNYGEALGAALGVESWMMTLRRGVTGRIV